MTIVTHVHRWQIAPADRDNPGGKSLGVCWCGAKKFFDNVIKEPEYRKVSDVSHKR